MTVTVESALSEARAATQRLGETVRELVLTAVEDQPRNCQVHLVTVVHDAALEVAAEADQAEAEMSRPKAEAVASSQRHVTLLGTLLVRELAAPELLDDLAALGRELGREVTTWVREVRRCIQACQLTLWTDVQPALLGYWWELAAATDRSLCPPTDADLEGQ